MVKITNKIIASREKNMFLQRSSIIQIRSHKLYVFYNVKIICFKKKKILSHR